MLPFNNVVQMIFTPPSQPLQLLCNTDCTNFFSLKIGVSEVHFKPLVLTRQDLVVVNRIRKTVSKTIAGGGGGASTVNLQIMLAEILALLIRRDVCPDMSDVPTRDGCTSLANGPAETEMNPPAHSNQVRWISCVTSPPSSDYLPQLHLDSSELVGDSSAGMGQCNFVESPNATRVPMKELMETSLATAGENSNFAQPVLSRNRLCPCGSGKKFKKCCELEADRPGKNDDLTQTVIGRKRLCPCGSGEKFKKCCELEAKRKGKTCNACGDMSSPGDLDEKFLFYCLKCWESCKSSDLPSAGDGVGESKNFPVGVPLEETKHLWLQFAIVKWTRIICNGIKRRADGSVVGLHIVTDNEYKTGKLPPFVTSQKQCQIYKKEVLTNLEANPALEVSLRTGKIQNNVQAFRFRAGFSAADALKWAENNCLAARMNGDARGEGQSAAGGEEGGD